MDEVIVVLYKFPSGQVKATISTSTHVLDIHHLRSPILGSVPKAFVASTFQFTKASNTSMNICRYAPYCILVANQAQFKKFSEWKLAGLGRTRR